ncbi:hypothetical protein ABIC32_000795 [Brevundimonas sp. 1080]|uniref:hypothetical protein n=1 Tax=Brevundimonas sp. 1080 TaxID=3156405 RepID=UPI00339A09DE
MQSLFAAGSWLPAVIDQRAALAAFKHVSQISWCLQFSSWDPVSVSVENPTELELCAQGIGTPRYEDRARGHVADQVLQIVGRMTDRHLRFRGIDASIRDDAAAQRAKLDDLRSFVLTRIRNDLNLRGESLPDIWCGRVEDELFWQSPEDANAVRTYLGMDQVIEPRDLRRGFNYVFKSMALAVDTSGAPTIKADPWKLGDVLGARYDGKPHERARNLVYRASCAFLALLPEVELRELSSDEVVVLLQAEIDSRMSSSGCWGLIDLAIAGDRQQLDLKLPALDPVTADRLLRLISEQEARRCRDLAGQPTGGGK